MQILNLSKLTKCVLLAIPLRSSISSTPYLLLPLNLPLTTGGALLMHGITRNFCLWWSAKTSRVLASVISSSFLDLAWLHRQILVSTWISVPGRLSTGMGLAPLVISAIGFASTRWHFPYWQTWSRHCSRPFLLLFKNEPIRRTDRMNVDRQYIKHCPGLSYLLTCNFWFNLEYGPPNV